MALAKQENLNVDSDAPKDLKGEQKVENKNESEGDEAMHTNIETKENDNKLSDENAITPMKEEEKKDNELDLLPPLRKYEPISACPDIKCKGDDIFFKMMHEWCYKQIDNFEIYLRVKQCPSYCLV